MKHDANAPENAVIVAACAIVLVALLAAGAWYLFAKPR